MHNAITEYARRANATVVISAGNIYVTKGKAETYPCIIAHTDTVHPPIPDRDFSVRSYQGIFYGWDRRWHRQVGCGGDDKVGIFLALDALRHLPAVKAAFFRDEEVGCLGSLVADLTFFDDVEFVLQFDRRGYGEIVTRIGNTELCGEDFLNELRPLLKRHDWQEVNGLLTDVLALKERGLAVSAVNIACGYYRPHTDGEYVVIDDVRRVRHVMYEMIDVLAGRRWSHHVTYGGREHPRSSCWVQGGVERRNDLSTMPYSRHTRTLLHKNW
ncbi:MAG: hypothetical protein C4321_00755 [Chloroflexota bacterium]